MNQEKRPPKLTDNVKWREVPEDDYYRAFANPLPKSWYFLASLAQRVGEGLRVTQRRRPQRPRPMPTGNCNRQASR